MTPLTDAELDLMREQAHNAQSFHEPNTVAWARRCELLVENVRYWQAHSQGRTSGPGAQGVLRVSRQIHIKEER